MLDASFLFYANLNGSGFAEPHRFGWVGEGDVGQGANERGKVYQHQVWFNSNSRTCVLQLTASISLLTLGTVIGTLADNSAKKKTDHVPFRNSKLTRLLQPSLSGDARISVICTINPDPSAIAESTSTLLFAKRIKTVKVSPSCPNYE